MVSLVVKVSGEARFLYKSTCDTRVDELIRSLVSVWNSLLFLDALAALIEGVSKRRLTELKGNNNVRNWNMDMSDSDQDLCAMFESLLVSDFELKNQAGNKDLLAMAAKAAEDARQSVSPEQIGLKIDLTNEFLICKTEFLRGAVETAFATTWPDIEKLIEKDIENRKLDIESAELWWASKKFALMQTLGDRCGKNEKTKLIVSLQCAGLDQPVQPVTNTPSRLRKASSPVSEATDTDTPKNAADDECTNSVWASASLRNQLNGTQKIEFR